MKSFFSGDLKRSVSLPVWSTVLNVRLGAGAARARMKPTVDKLTGEDMNVIAAYLASQQP